MPDLFLIFKPGTSQDEREALLKRLRTGDGVIRVTELSPGSQNSELSRDALVETYNDKAARRILAELRCDPAIESAKKPPRRPCFKPAHMARRV